MDREPCVALMSSNRNGTLYTGVTSDLVRRVWHHRTHVVDGFTARHRISRLVRHELHDTMESAIQREQRTESWNRARKVQLVDDSNASWRVLRPDVTGQGPASNLHGVPPARE